MKIKQGLNVFGQPLMACSNEPLTGFYRDGCCNTGDEDHGEHTVCVVVDTNFLEFSKKMGNDLITPLPEYGFKGLVDGDRWCLCAKRWMEALQAGIAPKVVLEASNEKILDYIELRELVKFAYIEEGASL